MSGTLGPVLVIGGGGFLGSAVTRFLHETGLWTPITVASRNSAEHIPNVYYDELDITSEPRVREILAELRPKLVLHLASPPYDAAPQTLYDCNVKGTEILLRCAKESPHVHALLYTSTNRVIANQRPGHLTEDMVELYHESSQVDAYSKSKAIADRMVLAANGPSLKTAVLRVPIVYGGRDTHMNIVMDLLHRGRQNVQLGDDTALFEFLYVGNAADAHACAAKELLTGDEAVNIAGEAFFITDDQPMTWFAFARLVWAEAGSTSSPGKNTVIPFWLLSALASVWEWLCWTTTLGRKPASGFTRYNIDVLRRGNNTLDIQKAKDRLGYVPRITREEGVRRAVRAYSTM